MKTNKKVVNIATILILNGLMYASNGPMQFNDIDTNKDGIINQYEYKIAKEKRIEEKKEEGRLLKNSDKTNFSDIDTNGDGIISQDEFKNHQINRYQDRPGIGKNR